MVDSSSLAMPVVGAGAWINGLFHVEQLAKGRFIPDDLAYAAMWNIM
jgi:hypothetical protein